MRSLSTFVVIETRLPVTAASLCSIASTVRLRQRLGARDLGVDDVLPLGEHLVIGRGDVGQQAQAIAIGEQNRAASRRSASSRTAS